MSVNPVISTLRLERSILFKESDTFLARRA